MTLTQQHIRNEIARADSYRAVDTDPADPCDEILTSWILVISSATREMKRALNWAEEMTARAQRSTEIANISAAGAWWDERAKCQLEEVHTLLQHFAEYQRLAFLAAVLSVGDDNPFFVGGVA